MRTKFKEDTMRKAIDLLIHLPEQKLPQAVTYLEAMTVDSYDTISVAEDVKLALGEVASIEMGKRKSRSARDFLNAL